MDLRGCRITAFKPDNNEHSLKQPSKVYGCFMLNKLASILIWLSCLIALLCCSKLVLLEYLRDDPITITTFVEPPPRPDPITITICNNVLFDPFKIENYKNAALNEDFYQFLVQTVRGNFSFDDRNFAVPIKFTYRYLLSSRTFERFKMDIDRFMFFCIISGVTGNCIPQFKWNLQSGQSCYSAIVNFDAYGEFHTMQMYFYFDPKVRFGRYTNKIGAYITVAHSEDHVSISDGFFLKPKDFALVSAEKVQRIQETSFPKSRCVHKYGLQTYRFTNGEFQVPYSVDTCQELCLAESFDQRCGCIPISGWNSSNSDCMEVAANRECIRSQYDAANVYINKTEVCFSKCVKKCNQKSLDLRILKTELDYDPKIRGLIYKNFVAQFGETELAEEWKSIAEKSPENSTHIFDQVSQNVAQLVVQLKRTQVKKIETILLMSSNTLLSNLAGLFGMFLGLSAVSVLEFVKEHLEKRVKCFPRFQSE